MLATRLACGAPISSGVNVGMWFLQRVRNRLFTLDHTGDAFREFQAVLRRYRDREIDAVAVAGECARLMRRHNSPEILAAFRTFISSPAAVAALGVPAQGVWLRRAIVRAVRGIHAEVHEILRHAAARAVDPASLRTRAAGGESKVLAMFRHMPDEIALLVSHHIARNVAAALVDEAACRHLSAAPAHLVGNRMCKACDMWHTWIGDDTGWWLAAARGRDVLYMLGQFPRDAAEFARDVIRTADIPPATKEQRERWYHLLLARRR